LARIGLNMNEKRSEHDCDEEEEEQDAILKETEENVRKTEEDARKKNDLKQSKKLNFFINNICVDWTGFININFIQINVS